ncbi:MAG TPA: hypothetical protein VGM90_07025 [Kofleriaceae bacterium]
MRLLVGTAVLFAASSASARPAGTVSAQASDDSDPQVSAAGSAGGGVQDGAVYTGLDLRFDLAWKTVRLGLGARGVLLDGQMRSGDWDRPADAVTILRTLEAHAGPAAIAAGALAPAVLGRIADGYRVALDDRAHTGARGAIATPAFEMTLEIDDVVNPALVGGAISWMVTAPWGIRAATAVDPSVAGGRVATELGGVHRWENTGWRVETGASVVAEEAPQVAGTPRSVDISGVAYSGAALDKWGARWTAQLDVRAGGGTLGAAFGPLYRVERQVRADMTTPLDDVRAGVAGGIALGVQRDGNWLALGARTRPGLGTLGTIAAGAPMNRWVQAAAWIAASPHASAGAAAMRVVWTKQLFSSVELARMYTRDEMSDDLVAAWSATAWFGASMQ